MYKNLRWKIVTILVVFVVFFGIGVYPLLAQRYHQLPAPAWLMQHQLKLGLDLKGGVHLVMRVNTDDALKLTTTSTSEQLRESLRTAGVTVGGDHPRRRPRSSASTACRRIATRSSAPRPTRSPATTYDRNPLAGGSYEFTMKPIVERDLREQTVDQALQTIDRRVNELGVAEPSIARQPKGDEILVQLPGVTDVARAKEIMGSPAILEFKLVESRPELVEGRSAQAVQRAAPRRHGDSARQVRQRGSADTSSVFYVVRKVAPVTGQDLRSAKPGLDENNQPAVHFELKSDGARKFGKLSGDNIGRYLAIVLDNRVVSAPRLEGRITDQGRISGGFTTESGRTTCR